MKRGSIVPEDVLGNLSESLRDMSNESDLKQSLPSEISPLQRGTFNSSLEEAGHTLISILPDPIRGYITEIATIVLHIPVWQLLLGSVMAQHESGNLTAPSIDPAWGQVDFVVGDSTCSYHGCPKPDRKFTPKRIGQVFCSNNCGDMDRKEKMLLARERNGKVVVVLKQVDGDGFDA